MKRQILRQLAVLILTAGFLRGEATNYYHFDRTFEPVSYSNGSPTAYKIMKGSKAMTGIVGPTNIILVSNLTYALEKEVMAWGYTNAVEAWTNTLVPESFMTHTGQVFDNVGWISGTRESYGTWGAYFWSLQNYLVFTSSESSVYVSPNGATSTIASVLVGTLGDYCPGQVVSDMGPPILATNFPGTNAVTNVFFKPDLTTYYKLSPSSLMGVNKDDSDGDGVPDFADGFNWDGSLGTADDRSTNDSFATWQIFLSTNVNITQALVNLSYNASYPGGVTFSATNGYAPASGCYRVWVKDASKARNKAAVTNGGDFVPAYGNIPASALGFSDANRGVELHVEAVNSGVDQQSVFSVDPDGTNTFKGVTCQDKWRASLFEVNQIRFHIGSTSEWKNCAEPQRIVFGKTTHLQATNVLPAGILASTYRLAWEGTFAVTSTGIEITHTYSGAPSTNDADTKTVRTQNGPKTAENFLVCTKVVGIHSNVDPTSGFTDGHAWISITDYSSGFPETDTFGLWPDEHPNVPNNGPGSDVRVGMEPSSGRHNRYYLLSPSQFDQLRQFIEVVADWTYVNTCANWAEAAYHAATGETVDSSDYVAFGTPRAIAESIEQLEATTPTSPDMPLEGGEDAPSTTTGSGWDGSSFF